MDSNPVNAEVESFNRRSLRKTSTSEKVILPTKEDIEQEKKEEKTKK